MHKIVNKTTYFK